MTLVKASEVDFHFPLIGWFGDGIRSFPNRELLLQFPAPFYEDGEFMGVELVDNSLRHWRVQSVDLCSPLPKTRWYHNRFLFLAFLPISFFLALMWHNNLVDVDLQLEELGALDLEEVKARFLREEEPHWTSFDPVGSPEYNANLAKVRDARDVAALVEFWDSNPGFLD